MLNGEGAVVGVVLDGEGVAAGGVLLGEEEGGVLTGEREGGELDGEEDAALGELDGEAEDAALGGWLDGEGAADGGVLDGEAAWDLDGDDAGDCALVEATNRAAMITKTTALERAIVERMLGFFCLFVFLNLALLSKGREKTKRQMLG